MLSRPALEAARDPTSPLAAERAYRVFHFAWCVFALLHLLLTTSDWMVVGAGFLESGSPALRLVAVAAVLLTVASLALPRRPALFAAAIAAWTVTKIDALPAVPNHILVALIASLALLAALTVALRAHPGDRHRAMITTLRVAAPPLRAILIAVYAFAVLHKSNADFFDPAVSCGAALYAEIAARLSILPRAGWASWLAIGGSWVLEAALPLLLLGRRTRTLALGVGLLFHLALSLHPNLYIASFSAEVFALYALFLPPAWSDRLGAGLERLYAGGFRRALIGGGAAYGLVALAWGIADPIGERLSLSAALWASFDVGAELARVLSFAWTGLLLLLWLRLRLHTPSDPATLSPARGLLAPRPAWALLFPALVIANGFSPYLGIKTATDLSMFSNLVVADDRSNHWIAPPSPDLSGNVGDAVRLLASNHPDLAGMATSPDALPFFELRRTLSTAPAPGLTVTFERAGRTERLTWPADADHEAFRPHPWLAAKLLTYRSIPPAGPCPCRW